MGNPGKDKIKSVEQSIRKKPTVSLDSDENQGENVEQMEMWYWKQDSFVKETLYINSTEHQTYPRLIIPLDQFESVIDAHAQSGLVLGQKSQLLEETQEQLGRCRVGYFKELEHLRTLLEIMKTQLSPPSIGEMQRTEETSLAIGDAEVYFYDFVTTLDVETMEIVKAVFKRNHKDLVIELHDVKKRLATYESPDDPETVKKMLELLIAQNVLPRKMLQTLKNLYSIRSFEEREGLKAACWATLEVSEENQAFVRDIMHGGVTPADLQERISELEAGLEEATARTQTLQASKDDGEQNSISMRQDLEEVENRCCVAEKEVLALEQQQIATEADLAGLKAEIKQQDDTIKDLEEELQELRSREVVQEETASADVAEQPPSPEMLQRLQELEEKLVEMEEAKAVVDEELAQEKAAASAAPVAVEPVSAREHAVDISPEDRAAIEEVNRIREEFPDFSLEMVHEMNELIESLQEQVEELEDELELFEENENAQAAMSGELNSLAAMSKACARRTSVAHPVKRGDAMPDLSIFEHILDTDNTSIRVRKPGGVHASSDITHEESDGAPSGDQFTALGGISTVEADGGGGAGVSGGGASDSGGGAGVSGGGARISSGGARTSRGGARISRGGARISCGGKGGEYQGGELDDGEDGELGSIGVGEFGVKPKSKRTKSHMRQFSDSSVLSPADQQALQGRKERVLEDSAAGKVKKDLENIMTMKASLEEKLQKIETAHRELVLLQEARFDADLVSESKEESHVFSLWLLRRFGCMRVGFRNLDADGSGDVSLSELEAALHPDRNDFLNFFSRRLMAQLDKDGDGAIDLNEIISGREAWALDQSANNAVSMVEFNVEKERGAEVERKMASEIVELQERLEESKKNPPQAVASNQPVEASNIIKTRQSADDVKDGKYSAKGWKQRQKQLFLQRKLEIVTNELNKTKMEFDDMAAKATTAMWRLKMNRVDIERLMRTNEEKNGELEKMYQKMQQQKKMNATSNLFASLGRFPTSPKPQTKEMSKDMDAAQDATGSSPVNALSPKTARSRSDSPIRSARDTSDEVYVDIVQRRHLGARSQETPRLMTYSVEGNTMELSPRQRPPKGGSEPHSPSGARLSMDEELDDLDPSAVPYRVRIEAAFTKTKRWQLLYADFLHRMHRTSRDKDSPRHASRAHEPQLQSPPPALTRAIRAEADPPHGSWSYSFRRPVPRSNLQHLEAAEYLPPEIQRSDSRLGLRPALGKNLGFGFDERPKSAQCPPTRDSETSQMRLNRSVSPEGTLKQALGRRTSPRLTTSRSPTRRVASSSPRSASASPKRAPFRSPGPRPRPTDPAVFRSPVQRPRLHELEPDLQLAITAKSDEAKRLKRKTDQAPIHDLPHSNSVASLAEKPKGKLVKGTYLPKSKKMFSDTNSGFGRNTTSAANDGFSALDSCVPPDQPTSFSPFPNHPLQTNRRGLKPISPSHTRSIGSLAHSIDSFHTRSIDSIQHTRSIESIARSVDSTCTQHRFDSRSPARTRTLARRTHAGPFRQDQRSSSSFKSVQEWLMQGEGTATQPANPILENAPYGAPL